MHLGLLNTLVHAVAFLLRSFLDWSRPRSRTDDVWSLRIYEPYRIRVSVFVKLAGGRRECGLCEVFTHVSLEDGALWPTLRTSVLGILLNGGEGKGCFGSICCLALVNVCSFELRAAVW